MGEKDVDPKFRLPRIPKEVMLQLSETLSLVDFPCLIKERLIDCYAMILKFTVIRDRMKTHLMVQKEVNQPAANKVQQ